MRVAVTWEMSGYIDVDADTMTEAIKKVREDSDNYSLPSENYYVDGSFRPVTDDADEMETICGVE